MAKVKLNVFSINDFEAILKGLVRIIDSAAIEVGPKGLKISANAESKIRAFIKSDCIKMESDDPDDSVTLSFESIANLIKMVAFVKDIGQISEECEFECDGVFIRFAGKGSIKLKLDKYELIERFVSAPIKSELKDLFCFNMTSEVIKKILSYSTFNTNYEVKLYFYLKNGILMCDIDDKKEMAGRLSCVSIPVTDKYKGVLEKPFILDLEDAKKFNIFEQPVIKCCLTDKCLKIASDFTSTLKNKEQVTTTMMAIVRLLKD